MVKLWLVGTLNSGCLRVNEVPQKTNDIWEHRRYAGEVIILAATEAEATEKYENWKLANRPN